MPCRAVVLIAAHLVGLLQKESSSKDWSLVVRQRARDVVAWFNWNSALSYLHDDTRLAPLTPDWPDRSPSFTLASSY